jgi:hypothetical protein
VLIGIAVVALAAVLIAAGRYENARASSSQVDGMKHVLALVGPHWATKASAYRLAHGFDCLLYKVGPDPYALELCFDQTGRIVEAVDRRDNTSPTFWTLQFDPAESTLRMNPAIVTAAFVKAGAIPKGMAVIPVFSWDRGPTLVAPRHTIGG